MGGKLRKFLPAFAALFVIAVIVRLVSAEFTLNRYLEWAFWALIVGLVVAVILMDTKDKKEIAAYKAKEANPEKATDTVAKEEGNDEVAKFAATSKVVTKTAKAKKVEANPAKEENNKEGEEEMATAKKALDELIKK